MVTISELKERKKELCYSNKMISDISGVPVSTLQKIFGGSTETPRYETLLKLERALFPTDRDLRVSDPYYRPDGGLYKMNVQEPYEAYSYSSLYYYDENLSMFGKRQGQFTVEDCLSLPDGVRMELIDGILYDIASPTVIHQTVILQVSLQIMNILNSSDGDCEVFFAPLDVQFEADDKDTLLQPDLMVVCEKEKYANDTERILGAPDMIMEVLSPSTRGKDRIIKLNKYGQEGVKEYWIVDPDNMEIQVYFYKNGFGPMRYTFDERVPISIFNGKASVDFSRISRVLRDRLGFGSED